MACRFHSPPHLASPHSITSPFKLLLSANSLITLSIRTYLLRPTPLRLRLLRDINFFLLLSLIDTFFFFLLFLLSLFGYGAWDGGAGTERNLGWWVEAEVSICWACERERSADLAFIGFVCSFVLWRSVFVIAARIARRRGGGVRDVRFAWMDKL